MVWSNAAAGCSPGLAACGASNKGAKGNGKDKTVTIKNWYNDH